MVTKEGTEKLFSCRGRGQSPPLGGEIEKMQFLRKMEEEGMDSKMTWIPILVWPLCTRAMIN